MRFTFLDHRGVVQPIVSALTAAGHELVEGDEVDLFLVDYDVDRFGYRKWIDLYADSGATVVLYPHGNGVPPVHYDGLFEPYEKIAGQLAFGPGEERLLRTLGIERPVCDVGWVGVEQLPFRPCDEVRRVTFAPIHPSPDGRMIDLEREANSRAFERLLEGPWELTVRFLQRLDDNGLWPDKRARYVMGLPDGSVGEIDSADVVVAGWGSYLTLAVARGCPAVTYCQDGPAYSGAADDPPVERHQRRLYDDFVRYPFDLDDGPAEEIVSAAARDGVRDWRDVWIAPALEPAELASRIERFVSRISNGHPKRRLAKWDPPTWDATPSEKFARSFRDLRLPHEFRWAPRGDQVQVMGSRLFWRPDGGDRYLELLKRAILNICAPRDEGNYLRFLGLDDAEDALSTSGYERLSYLQKAIGTVLSEDVPGDVAEIGVGKGGGAMLIRAALGDDSRLLWAVDAYAETSLEAVNESFVRYGVETYRVSFVCGLFAAAIPEMKNAWSLIRVDGGLEATALVLEHLVPDLSPGGFLILNDFETSGASELAFPSELRGPRQIDPVGVAWRRS